jgi:hypothetical protein
MKNIFSFSNENLKFILLFIVILFLFYIIYLMIQNNKEQENMENIDELLASIDSPNPLKNPYLTTLKKHETERHHPYRYFHDENNNILPIVAVTAFFRDDKERVDIYNEYVDNNIKVIGITAYKSFPKPITDMTGDSNTKDDPFNYYKIRNWLCCFKNPSKYGFSSTNNLTEMSESDWYNADENAPYTDKKYDIIYICLKDTDTCPANGWNAINRNFDLAQKCFPILINEFNLKVLVIGRVGCGLETLYGDKIEVTDFLPFHEFQQKLKQSRILFVPNIYDASPRVVAESIIKDIPVLMNQHIVCGSKYINSETGELFTDEHDIRLAVTNLMSRIDTISPKKWWGNNYSTKKCAKKLREFLYPEYPDVLEKVEEIYFYL